MSADVEQARKFAGEQDISSSLAYGQIAVAENLAGIRAELGDLAKLATTALGVVLDGRDVDIVTRTAGPSIPPRTDLVERLSDVLRETYESSQGQPIWPLLATAALEFMED